MSAMSRVLSATRYLIVLPILGLLFAAGLFFVLGGIALVGQLLEVAGGYLAAVTHTGSEVDKGVVIFEVVEYVHLFLVGTVLYITAVGLYQLFIRELDFPRWLKIDSTEELETNLIGVTVVVLAVNFMGAVFVGDKANLLQFGAGIALPIAALGLFVGLRAWSVKLGKETAAESEDRAAGTRGQDTPPTASQSESSGGE
jgi:uncharacterized membrane protein YqhA